jgi:hypothetical protein
MCGLVAFGLLVWSFVLDPWPVGATAEWVAGLGSFAAVAVALWQSVILRSAALEEAAEAADRFTRELAAAKERMETELAAAEGRHRIELDAQRELARIQRVHLREQEFKLALIRVTRAVNAYTHTLATLTEEGRRLTKLPERQEREDALLPTSEELNLRASDIVIEVSGAHMLTRNDALHEALNGVVQAALGGAAAETAIRDAVINNSRMPEPNPVPRVQAKLQAAIGNARQMAGDLLDTGWD